MPYLTWKDKEKIESGWPVGTAGELNFAITLLVKEFLAGQPKEGKSYEALNAAMGALECCKLELYRRIVAPYEDVKIKENGDVY